MDACITKPWGFSRTAAAAELWRACSNQPPAATAMLQPPTGDRQGGDTATSHLFKWQSSFNVWRIHYCVSGFLVSKLVNYPLWSPLEIDSHDLSLDDSLYAKARGSLHTQDAICMLHPSPTQHQKNVICPCHMWWHVMAGATACDGWCHVMACACAMVPSFTWSMFDVWYVEIWIAQCEWYVGLPAYSLTTLWETLTWETRSPTPWRGKHADLRHDVGNMLTYA